MGPLDFRKVLSATAGLLACGSVLLAPALGGSPEGPSAAFVSADSSGCLQCHAGIEDMHPEAELSCVDCHGGDGTATLKLEAHAEKPRSVAEDERVPPADRGLAWARFRNPMDLRIVDRTCGTCHSTAVEHLASSLHGTTAGHLSDGYYEMGLSKKRGSRYGVFPVSRAPKEGGEVSKLYQVPPFMDNLPEDELATHFTDLARKECMQCHLWSEGRAVRGRVGFDGDYRGDGCAACHVEYAIDGFSESADRTVPRGEPGHPRSHTMTAAPGTQTCSTCHYGDASIGLHFRGLSQLPPNTPGGPEIPGTTDEQLNRVFYLNDPAIVPPDVHHEKGMHCIDCHTVDDVMGDGELHGQMEYAVEISCQSCHGSFTERTDLRTEEGSRLKHLRRDGDRVILTSKVDGREHPVPQVVDVLDPKRPEFNPDAAEAMNAAHGNVECYTCHAGWNVNFLGFHFSRLEQLSQLDLLSGKRTPGRVTTQEKVFATWKSFYAGLNEKGAVAPYLTGFSTMGSVWDEDGELKIDQAMPVTAEGLSGMTMIHHQLHSTRPTARGCVECHRSSATWGLGSANFRLARQLAFIADRRGIEVLGVNRSEPARSVALTKMPLPDVVDLVAHCDDLQGHAHHLYAAEGGRGIHVIDVQDPTRPHIVEFVATINPRGLELVGDHLYVADGIGGVRIFDVTRPEEIHEVGSVPTFDAHDVDVKWPWAYVADGPGGLAILDVRAPIAPRFLSALDVNGESQVPNEASLVETLFQYSRPQALEGVPVDRRVPARNLAAVLDRERGLVLVDVTEPTLPRRLYPTDRMLKRSTGGNTARFRGLALLSQVDPAEAQGGERTAERDYAYVLVERGSPANRRSIVRVMDVSDPERVPPPGRNGQVETGFATEQLVAGDFYNPPFRQRLLFVPGELGVYMTDVSTSRESQSAGVVPGLRNAFAVALEEFPLDRMVSESGDRLKDVSHPDSRWLYRTEIERILGVSAEKLGIEIYDETTQNDHGLTARLHLERLDADRSGILEGKEYEEAGGATIDTDGDGRITMIELAFHSGLLGNANAPNALPPEPLMGARVLPDGELARLLDRVRPLLYDRDEDSRLDRKEVTRAFFDALDLDGDGRVDQDEYSRHPGSARELRFGGAVAQAAFRRIDKRKDGSLTLREFELRDEDWNALDSDGDGSVRLDPGRLAYQRERGFVGPSSEWPTRQDEIYPLPPGLSLELLMGEFDADGDGLLTVSELRRRPDLFEVIDGNRDEVASAEEVDRLIRRVVRGGVDMLVDDFLGRHDLDGSGRVEPDELPALTSLRLGPVLGTR